jgi:PKD repeat protein
VSLSLSGPFGSDVETRDAYITVYQPPAAAFEAHPPTGFNPLQVHFTNLSTGDFNACQWDFGDSQTSSDCDNPSHTYTAPGLYTVSLAVSGPGGADVLTLPDLIEVEPMNYLYLPSVTR